MKSRIIQQIFFKRHDFFVYLAAHLIYFQPSCLFHLNNKHRWIHSGYIPCFLQCMLVCSLPDTLHPSKGQCSNCNLLLLSKWVSEQLQSMPPRAVSSYLTGTHVAFMRQQCICFPLRYGEQCLKFLYAIIDSLHHFQCKGIASNTLLWFYSMLFSRLEALKRFSEA